MSAAERFTRIVSLVADLTRRQRDGEEAPTIGDLARLHGVPESVIAADIRTLTLLGSHADTDWLLSLRIWQQGEQVSIASGGPFRRPVRLSPEEMLAVQCALAMDPDGAPLAHRLAAVWTGEIRRSTDDTAAGSGPARRPPALPLIRESVERRQVLEIEYAGERDTDVRTRMIHPYQVAEVGVRTYVVAWVPDVGAWRHFRLDRIASVRVATAPFVTRDDFTPIASAPDTFRPDGPVDRVTVRFRAESADWVTEFYVEHDVQPDGSVHVQFPASSPAWLTRRVLEYGADAEVVKPAEYREAVRRAIA